VGGSRGGYERWYLPTPSTSPRHGRNITNRYPQFPVVLIPGQTHRLHSSEFSVLVTVELGKADGKAESKPRDLKQKRRTKEVHTWVPLVISFSLAHTRSRWAFSSEWKRKNAVEWYLLIE
jgi:hypothetical protein